ncbi:MAG TPA: zinc ribbon domain-containing protein [Nocardioides sp.]|uniref:zinc ribbon domain-containing protein n=1 Tax=Nocardioides sp. TaxID=35761 RepID=UPI002F3EFBCC
MSTDPTTPPPGIRGQRVTRNVFRVVGLVALVVALGFIAVGLQDFFASADSFDGPHKFWMIFVGIFGVAIAVWCLQAGFMGAASRYVAGETAPVIKDSAAYLTDGEGVLGVGRTVDDAPAPHAAAVTGPYCSKCGTRNDDDASFCDSCGAALAR